MPCYDGRENVQTEYVDNPKHMALVCGLLTANGIGILDRVNWKEVGVTRKWVEDWWERHQRQDIARRKAEEERAKARRVKQEALNKARATLTPAQLKALGLK